MSRLSLLLMTGLVTGTPWHFDNQKKTTTSTDGAYIELQTGPTKNYIPLHEMGMEVTHAQNFIFQVRAIREVHIALQANAGETRQGVYEITIGGWANTLSVIRKAVNDGRIMVDYRHQPLNRTEFRTFWIRWGNSRVSVGSGENVGVDAFMMYRDPAPHPVNYVSVSTGWGVTGMWKFEAPIPVIGVWTNPQEDLQFHSLTKRGYKVESVQHLVFWVKATNDANVLLTTRTQPYKNMFWVSLGGFRNTMSFIRKGRMGSNKARALHSPLSKEHYLPFWMSWEDGVVAVGEGTDVRRGQFMAFTDPSPFTVTEVLVSTGEGSSGHWLVYLAEDQWPKELPKSAHSLTLNG